MVRAALAPQMAPLVAECATDRAQSPAATLAPVLRVAPPPAPVEPRLTARAATEQAVVPPPPQHLVRPMCAEAPLARRLAQPILTVWRAITAPPAPARPRSQTGT